VLKTYLIENTDGLDADSDDFKVEKRWQSIFKQMGVAELLSQLLY
jgi:hypothetical protein